jgi:N-acetylglucosaminyldiphosphoundecaprenol N-acetyl-beta-D-mannosaminyltransferase
MEDEEKVLAGLTPQWSPTDLSLPSTGLFGLAVSNASLDHAVDWLLTRLKRGERTRVAFVNAHCVNLAANRPAYKTALVEADAILPDGSGIALAARFHGTPLIANLNGTDLVPLFCARLAYAGYSVFLLGGQPGVAAAAAAALQRTCPGLSIAGTHHGFFLPNGEDQVIAEINASGADVVLTAMGVPLQETWLQRVAPRLTATTTVGVGGLFDFLSGRIPRAPSLLRRFGLEWIYRLYQEPLRMWQRYILGNPAFIARAAAEALRQRTAACRQPIWR